MTIDASDLVLVSIDDHTIEPPDLFEGHVPAKYVDQAPRIVVDTSGDCFWEYAGARLPNIGLGAVAGRPNDEWGFEPSRFEDMRLGCFDVHERVRDMDIAGVMASLCFPSFPTISGALFTFRGEPEVSEVMVHTYNEWHLDEWCGAYPDRFIPLGILPLWDAELTAREVHWLASKGCRAVTVPQHIGNYGGQPWQHPSWDPLWRACVEESTIVNIHIGTGGGVPVPSDLTNYLAYNAIVAIDAVRFTADLLFSRVITDFPELKIALSEGGIGWIPFVLERFEDIYSRQRAWTGDDLGDGLTPTDVFRRNFIACFIRDQVGVEMREKIGIDNICWELDYPHSDSSWPDTPEQLAEQLEGCTPAEVEAICWGNASRMFHYDAVERLGREACTVRALRSTLNEVDLAAPKVRGGSCAQGRDTTVDLWRHEGRDGKHPLRGHEHVLRRHVTVGPRAEEVRRVDDYGVPLTPADAAFRDEILELLATELTPELLAASRDRSDDVRVESLREWQRRLHQAGLAAVSWPVEHGGRGATVVQQLVFNAELARHRAPDAINRSAINQLGPTIIQWGDDAQREHYLPRILSGADVWCQGFSEPDAGSDLASLRTRAVLDGDDFVVTGQKIWTSKAQYADWIYILARTNPDAPKHQGISFLLVDLRTPGIEIRPIRQITGTAEFNEVFFTDVRVPSENVVGPIDAGWRVANSTLGYERVGQSRTHRIERRLAILVSMATDTRDDGTRPIDDASVRDRLVRFAAQVEALRQIAAQATAAGVRGVAPGPEASVAKLLTSEVDQAMASFGMDMAGVSGVLQQGSDGAAKGGNVAKSYLLMRAATLGAGTSEIQRNVIGEKLLGLPRDH